MTDIAALPRCYATPPGVALCALDDIADGAARGMVVLVDEARFHGFVVRSGEEVAGYVDRCPHMGMPLARALDDYLTPDGAFILCGWHGAIFETDTGRCMGGPCAGQSLMRWPVANRGGTIETI